MTTDTPARGPSLDYRSAGVDIDAGAALVEAIKPLAASTARPGSGAELGGFGGLFDLKAAGFRDPVLVAANDGVGTKVKIAIETGLHSTIGVDLVAMCVNDVVVQGAEPLFFLDYYASGRLDVAVAHDVVAGIAEGCRQAGCALIGGETAEMPGLYAGRDYDLAGFCVGAAERGTLLPRADIAAGDALIALASSGVHSNGFSLVRRIVAQTGLPWDAPAPFAPQRALGEALLDPTRIYVRAALAAIRQTGAVKALAHITGGGLTENLPRILPKSLAAQVDLSAIAAPPVFGWLSREGRVAQAEMLRAFNCGVGMIAVVQAERCGEVIAAFEAAGETAYVIGQLAPRGDGDAVRLSGHLDWRA